MPLRSVSRWSLVLWLAFVTASLAACVRREPPPNAEKHFVGSEKCASCHQDVYNRWKDTLMAKVIQDPAKHPEAIVADFSTPNPLVTFRKEDIAFTYGTKWKQRYFSKRGDDYYVFPAQWDVRAKTWRRYFVENGTDWWAVHYPPDQMQRPTGPLCDGCHSVNYDIKTKTVTEWNVGCEKCHGPGSLHVEFPVAKTIVNPAKLDGVRADDVCLQCHSQGQPRTKPLDGVYYDWPVGFKPGDRLSDVWALEEHDLGKETFTHWPDGTAHKNRMQGNDFVQSVMYERGVTCASCHDAHGTEYNAQLRQPVERICLDCHAPGGPNGPRAATLEAHTHHRPESTGSQCVACHMPKIETEGVPGAFVRSHTFKFVTPTMTDQYKIPNPCSSCHQDKPSTWAGNAMRSWAGTSPWRVE
jgi:predicted CXXCH cytochrome family protein